MGVITWLVMHVPYQRTHANGRSPVLGEEAAVIMSDGVRGLGFYNLVLSSSMTNAPGDLLQITNKKEFSGVRIMLTIS